MTRPERELMRWLGNALTDSCRTTSLVEFFPEANKYVDGVPVSDNFETIRESSDTITALLRVTEEGVDLNNNEAIQKVLATFNRKSQCTKAKEYITPPRSGSLQGIRT